MPVSIKLSGVVKSFGTVRAVDDVSLTIEAGELFFLLGPSGCGKTTLLRCVAGFHQPEAGTIRIGDEEVGQLPPHRRNTGMVFQSYALWPHLTVAENVAFGLKMRKVPRAEIRRRVGEALERVHLGDRAASRPNQLSGGQQQRVALARALVIEPQCLLLDEPLSNLDAKLRLEMRVEIRRICKQAGLTAIYVTHDQKEALSVADRLAVMRDGRVEQIGAPREVYRRPANRFVAGFIGEGNFLDGRVRGISGTHLYVETALGRFEAVAPVQAPVEGSPVTLCLRPESIRLDAPAGAVANVFEARLRQTVYQGEVAQHVIAVGEGDGPAFRVFELGSALREDDVAGRRIRCWVPPDQVVVL